MGMSSTAERWLIAVSEVSVDIEVRTLRAARWQTRGVTVSHFERGHDLQSVSEDEHEINARLIWQGAGNLRCAQQVGATRCQTTTLEVCVAKAGRRGLCRSSTVGMQTGRLDLVPRGTYHSNASASTGRASDPSRNVGRNQSVH